MVSVWFPVLLIALLYLLVLLTYLPSSFSTLRPAIPKPQQLSRRQVIIHSQHGAAALLPLVYFDRNVTSLRKLKASHGRQLGGGARMTLYDDLLKTGYYTNRIWIGTPAQEFSLIVDTGSTVTYVPCASCTHCGIHQDPAFLPNSSSSYKPLVCGTDCETDFCDSNKQCQYERQYAEMSTTRGLLGKDLISFGNNSLIGGEHLVFGCENDETGDLFYQRADGIMGLGRGPLSVVDQLVKQGALSNSFSLCYGGMDEGGGAMILGAIPPPPDMVFTASDPNRSPYYNLKLKGLRVAGNPLSLDPSVFDGRYGTVLDSGTTYAYFPKEAYNVFLDAVKQQLGKLKEVATPDPNFPYVCFAGAGSDRLDLPKYFPLVDLVFGGGEVVSLAPENYLFRHARVSGAYCLGIFKNEDDETTLLGGIIVRNMLVTYNRANDTIGFWKTNCTDLWTNLPAVVAPATECSNGTSPSAELPAQYIGGLEVQLVLSMNYSIFSNLTSEFIEEIAHELDVNTSQVRILKCKDLGKNVSVLWLLSPEATENKLLEATAQSIISCLQRHTIHLGGHFRTYELKSWKIVPSSNRSLAIIPVIFASAIAVIAIGSVVYWHLWRRYKSKGNYVNLESLGDEETLEQL